VLAQLGRQAKLGVPKFVGEIELGEETHCPENVIVQQTIQCDRFPHNRSKVMSNKPIAKLRVRKKNTLTNLNQQTIHSVLSRIHYPLLSIELESASLKVHFIIDFCALIGHNSFWPVLSLLSFSQLWLWSFNLFVSSTA
jgi:hypothetical protein